MQYQRILHTQRCRRRKPAHSRLTEQFHACDEEPEAKRKNETKKLDLVFEEREERETWGTIGPRIYQKKRRRRNLIQKTLQSQTKQLIEQEEIKSKAKRNHKHK